MLVVMAFRAIKYDAWHSRLLTSVALLIGIVGCVSLLRPLSLHNADIYNYWTYWFWTKQRY